MHDRAEKKFGAECAGLASPARSEAEISRDASPPRPQGRFSLAA